MAALALGVAGAWVGNALGWGIAALGMTGAQVGWALGSMAGSALFGPDLPDQVGPRLSDRTIQSSAYGIMIPVVKGRMRIAGNIIWATDLVEISHTDEYGGKGGGGGTITTFSYYANAAISICEGEKIVRKVWADGKLIYDITDTNTGYTGKSLPLRFYTGSETQEPDPLIESVQGVGSTPAYRGQCYMVMERFALADYGNRIPNFTFEVVDGSMEYPALIDLGSGTRAALDRQGRLWVVSSNTTVDVWDTETQTMLVRNTVSAEPTGNFSTGAHTPYYVRERDEMWVSNKGNGSNGTGVAVWRFSPRTLAQKGTLRVTATGTPAGTSMAYSESMRKIILFNDYSGTNTARLIDVDDLTMSYAPGTSKAATDSIAIENRDFVVSQGGLIYGLLITSLSDGARIGMIPGPLSDNCIYYDSDEDFLLWSHSGGVYKVNLDTFETTLVYTSAIRSVMAITKDKGYYYLSASALAQTRTITVLNSDFTVIETITTGDHPGPGYGDSLFMLADKLWAIGGDTGLGILPHYKLVAATNPTLASVVTWLSVKAGLETSDIDVSAMSDTVTGCFITRAAPARSLLEPLLATYRYDGVESDNVIKFVKRGSAPVAALMQDDLILEDGNRIVTSNIRAQESDLPRRVSVLYANPDANYQQSTQFSQRMTGNSLQAVGVELPLVLTDDVARRVADTVMYEAHSSRTVLERSISRRWATLEPTDVINYVSGGVTYRVRIVDKAESGGVLQLRLIADDTSITTFSGSGAPSPEPGSILSPIATTLLELLDVTMFRDTDNDLGFYIAACGTNPSWPGCILYRSADDGASWAAVATITTPATMGAATTILPSGRTDIIDEASTVTVRLSNGSLSSTTYEALLNKANACLLGDEVLQFRTATLVDDNTYTLSGLCRGRRGTEHAVGMHAVGDRFVLLSAAAIRRVQLDSAEIGATRLYKAVTFGSFLESAPEQNLTFNNVAQECYSPVQIGGGRNSPGDITLKWVRRGRIGADWHDYADIPLGEALESYDVEVWTAGYTTLKRTFAGVTAPQISYTAANQVADFGSTQATVYVRIYQNSATMGRGYALEGTI